MRVAVLIIATLMVGLMAGVFFVYAVAVMPGLEKTNDRTFVGAFQQIDTAIINPLFLLGFFGALVFTGVAVALHLGEDYRSALPWLVAAFVLYLVGFVATVAVNVPLNDAIKAAGSPDSIADLAGVREEFNETRWVASNIVRTFTSTAALGCLAWALVLVGRVGNPGGN